MKIAHLCLSNYYADKRAYQENQLVAEHVDQGHEVLVIASTETQDDERGRVHTEPGRYFGSDGAPVIRLPYHGATPGWIGRKLRVHPDLGRTLEEFQPRALLFHGLCGWELLTAARYVEAHPESWLYADTHTDWNNSARAALSRILLHRGYYRAVLRRAEPSIRKILCVSFETMAFARDVYGLPSHRMEFFPLGGRPIPPGEYQRRRETTRHRYELSDSTVLFVQSGKITRRKKLLESLAAFRQVAAQNTRFLVAGTLMPDIEDQARAAIASDPRVDFLGWQDPGDLEDLLCAADVYVQPGTQSATMQTSLCAHCAIVLADAPSHGVYHRGNGWLLDDTALLPAVLREAASDGAPLRAMQDASYAVAVEMLDYRTLARRILVP